MATWRCPNCGTLQTETSRCFLCQRSATSCGTCAMFRASLVGGVGYCANDRKREPLSGSEQRPCWAASSATTSDGFFDEKPAADPVTVVLERGLHEVPLHAPQVPISER
ncbi:MAG: hypothetical protein QFC55_02550 [Chloroflexota bacterium]|nr:hypothetical protein [Chloroflexota bacterium]